MKDELDKLRALHEAATPGPWKLSPQGGAIRATKQTYNWKGEPTGTITSRIAATHDSNGAQRDADYALIVAMQRTFLDLIAQAERANALEAALEWYGEQARRCRLIHSEGDAGRQALATDGGKRASAALEKAGVDHETG